jgi:hypothetical protein
MVFAFDMYLTCIKPFATPCGQMAAGIDLKVPANSHLAGCRTNAVWCMTGHILGLGDRHGENIMIDMVR